MIEQAASTTRPSVVSPVVSLIEPMAYGRDKAAEIADRIYQSNATGSGGASEKAGQEGPERAGPQPAAVASSGYWVVQMAFTFLSAECSQNGHNRSAKMRAVTYATLGGSHVSILSRNDEDRRLRRTSKAQHLSMHRLRRGRRDGRR
jgi:hypothetical protein